MPRLPDNIEPSFYRKGDYVAYDPRGNVWHVSKCDREWRAKPAANNPARGLGVTITATSLTATAAAIASRQPATAVLPF